MKSGSAVLGTPKIAKLVNEKLKLAAESLFAPQGVEVVRL